MIAVLLSLATLASVDALRKGHLLPVSASVAGLRGVGRIHFHAHSPGAFSLDEKQRKEQRPGRVRDAFCETVVVNHAVHFQVFHSDKTKPVDDPPRLLVGEVKTAKRDAFMDAGNGLTPFFSLGRALHGFAESSLCLRQFLFIGAEEPGVVDSFSVRPDGKHGECGQANIDTYLFGRLWHRFWASDFAGERNVPFARRGSANCAGLRFSFDGAVQYYFDRSDFGENEFVFYHKTTRRALRKRHAVVAELATKTWVAWLLTSPDATEERLEREVDANGDVLQNLRVDCGKRRVFFLQDRDCGLLFVQPWSCLRGLIAGLALLQKMVVHPATFVQLGFQDRLLCPRWKQPVLECLTHRRYCCLNSVQKQGLKPE